MTTMGKALLTALIPLSLMAPTLVKAQKSTAGTLPYPTTLSYDYFKKGMASHRDTIMKVVNGRTSLLGLKPNEKEALKTLLSQTPQTPDNQLAFAIISDFMRQQTAQGFIPQYMALLPASKTAEEACNNSRSSFHVQYPNKTRISLAWKQDNKFNFNIDYPDNCSTCETTEFVIAGDDNPQNGIIEFSLTDPKSAQFPYSGLAIRKAGERRGVYHPPKPTATSPPQPQPANSAPAGNNSPLNGLNKQAIQNLYEIWQKDKGNEGKTMRDFIIEMNTPPPKKGGA